MIQNFLVSVVEGFNDSIHQLCKLHNYPIITNRMINFPNETETQDAKKNQIDSSLKSEEKIPVHDALYLDSLHDFSQG